MCSSLRFTAINKQIVFLSNKGYAILISNIIKGHQRSLEVKKTPYLENAFRDAVLWILIYMINWKTIECEKLRFMVEKGQQQLNRVQALSYSYLDLDFSYIP